MNEENIKPSLAELAVSSTSAMIMGIGGGGDVIQAIPVANYLSLLGVENIAVGGVGSQWWDFESVDTTGNKMKERKGEWGRYVLGPTVFDVNELTDIELWAPNVVGVSGSSNIGGRVPCEAKIRHLLPWDTFIGGLSNGVVGLRDSLRQVIKDRKVDLFIGVDIGSDSFHDGNEVCPPETSFIDFMSISAMIQLNCPVVHAFSGYGCDGEMEMEELDERLARVMKADGYLGAYGLSQRDCAQMLEACKLFPDPIEPFAVMAARGEFGFRKVEVVNPWRRIRVTPLASVVIFSDPHVLADVVATGTKELKETKSVAEAERVFKEKVGQYPETWFKNNVSCLGPEYVNE